LTTLTWADAKHRAIEAFNGELPNADTEQTILDAFQIEPVAVVHALDQVIEDFRAGKARSGWAIWRSRILTAARTPNVQVAYADSRQRQITIAEAWIRNAGGYIDRESELVSELFGDLGKLREWPDLEPRMVELWASQRERFAKAEREAEERNNRQAENRKRIQPTRRKCQFCDTIVRNELGVCAQHRALLEEDFRYAEPPDDDYLESIGAVQAEHEAA
jgi:hypothetical protein